MLMVCNKHVKAALKSLDVPHVKKIKHYKCICSFCNKEAEIKILSSIPISRKMPTFVEKNNLPPNLDCF